MAVQFLNRFDWGADPRSVVLGAAIPHQQFVGLVIHHTVIDYVVGGDAAAYMRRLQRSRPDLGLEVPYSFVIFETEDPNSCIVAEGRGWGRSGAHTVGYNCLDPSHKVLTSDLRWVPAGSLVAGDELLGFDEHASGTPGSCRGLAKSVVLHNAIEDEERFLVTLEDGSEIITTGEHPWLVYSGHNFAWVETRNLRFGGKVVSRVVRSFDPWEMEDTRDAGWLAGFLDGEGCISASRTKGACYAHYAQKPGPIMDKATDLLAERGFSVAVQPPLGGRSTAAGQIRGGASETFRLLGTIRPERLIRNLLKKPLPTMRALGNVGIPVVSVVPIGVGPIARLGTSTKTYFAEGFAMHNSTSYGIALAGNFTDHAPTAGMLEGIRWIGRQLYDPLGALATIGHRDTGYATACPGDSAEPLLHLVQPPFTEAEEDMALSEDDVRRIAAAVWERATETYDGFRPAANVVGLIYDQIVRPDLLVRRVAEAVPASSGTAASARDIAQQTMDLFHERLSD